MWVRLKFEFIKGFKNEQSINFNLFNYYSILHGKNYNSSEASEFNNIQRFSLIYSVNENYASIVLNLIEFQRLLWTKWLYFFDNKWLHIVEDNNVKCWPDNEVVWSYSLNWVEIFSLHNLVPGSLSLLVK